MTSQGLQAETFVLETYFQSAAQKKLLELKKQIHQSFSFAKMAQKVSSDIKSSYDPAKIDALYRSWGNCRTIHLVVFSGFWVSIIDQFYADYKHQLEINVQIIHMDASWSASWKPHDQLSPDYKHNWLYNLSLKAVNFTIGTTLPVIPFSERANEVLIHGGGWGIGTYQRTLKSAIRDQYHLNVIAYAEADVTDNPNITFYQQKPRWNAWIKDENGKHTFPPLIHRPVSQAPPKIEMEYNGCSPIYRIVASAQAIISKPGGATIMDSLHAATPLIFLENYGKYETDNAQLWQSLGLGMPFTEWEETGFDGGLLHQMHKNILHIRSQTLKIIDRLTRVAI